MVCKLIYISLSVYVFETNTYMMDDSDCDCDVMRCDRCF